MSLDKIKKYLQEVYTNNLIVVDVQPMYEKYIDFNIEDFVNYITKFNNILYFYVGSENSGIGTDTKEDIIFWLLENGLNEDLIDNITFIDKGYAFFRGKMDGTTFDDDDIVSIVKYLIDNDLADTRDIEDVKVRNNLGLEESPDDEDDPLYLPAEFDIEEVRPFNNSVLIGGGADECLREIELYLRAYDIKYTKNYDFIY